MPRPASTEDGQRAILARLLAPFAQDRSERIARTLIDRFGCFGTILETAPSRLANALPLDLDVIDKLVAARELVSFGLQVTISGSRVDVRDPKLHDFLRCKLGNSAEERFVAIFLNCDRTYLGDEIFGSGSVSHVQASTRSLVRRALDLGAHAIILAHNHPSGNYMPSESDHASTRSFELVTSAMGIQLIDHLIITAHRAFSLKLGKVV